MNDRVKCLDSSLHALRLAPDGYICKLNHALALSINGKIDEGIAVLENLKELNKTDDLFNQLALMYEVSGNIKQSNKYLMESFKLNNNNYAMLAKLIENDVLDEKDLDYKIEDRYNEDKLATLKEKHHLARCLYISYNRKKNYTLAGKYLVESNQYRGEILKYDIKNDGYFIEKLIDNFDKKILSQSIPRIVKKTDPTPIFILGMPRSGTTLTEQILASHSKVHGGGELDYVRSSIGIDRIYDLEREVADKTINQLLNFNDDEWAEKGKKYIKQIQKINTNHKSFFTDKMPHNFLFIPLICAAFPETKIIHVQRNAAATCWSNYKQYFSQKGLGYSYDLNDVVAYYHLYIGLKLQLLTFDLSSHGKKNKIAIAPNIKATPPSLSGTALKIA